MLQLYSKKKKKKNLYNSSLRVEIILQYLLFSETGLEQPKWCLCMTVSGVTLLFV